MEESFKALCELYWKIHNDDITNELHFWRKRMDRIWKEIEKHLDSNIKR